MRLLDANTKARLPTIHSVDCRSLKSISSQSFSHPYSDPELTNILIISPFYWKTLELLPYCCISSCLWLEHFQKRGLKTLKFWITFYDIAEGTAASVYVLLIFFPKDLSIPKKYGCENTNQFLSYRCNDGTVKTKRGSLAKTDQHEPLIIIAPSCKVPFSLRAPQTIPFPADSSHVDNLLPFLLQVFSSDV